MQITAPLIEYRTTSRICILLYGIVRPKLLNGPKTKKGQFDNNVRNEIGDGFFFALPRKIHKKIGFLGRTGSVIITWNWDSDNPIPRMVGPVDLLL